MARAQEIVIEVDGMTCGHCERHVAEALSKVPGVASASASTVERRAVVTADPTVAAIDELRAAIADAGYVPGQITVPE